MTPMSINTQFSIKWYMLCDSSIAFHNQIALPINLNVQMDNASQLVGNVIDIRTAWIKVMNLIAVSVEIVINMLSPMTLPIKKIHCTC